jgi:hypothetical protein
MEIRRERCSERGASDIIRRVDIVDHALFDQQADHVGESQLGSSDEDGIASLHME